MTTTKSYDYLNRLRNITSTPAASGESAAAFDYAYNDANQRTRVNMADGSFWIYEYDKLGQVTSGKRYWNDWTPVAGQQYEYAFDDIGNRSATKAGGDQAGAALRAASYTANALNQYTSRDVPAYLNVLGIAHANASVTVNSQSPYRRGEYFWQELSVNNASAALWQPVTNIASLSGTSQTNSGNLFLPKTAETYTYDLDGNLTSDGRWTNKWDGENRLVDMTSHSSGPSGSRKSLQFGYDSQGRRFSKIVSNWTGSAWTRALHEKFVYDGWNLLGALDGTNNAIIRSFLWSLDLSGSLQGAGGVGGLICFRQDSGSSAGSHFAAYDGNGNVMALVDGSTGDVSARYEYDPFGQTIRASGAMATLNPVRFSSKHVDDETDYAYYGYRFYNPSGGAWLSRDPTGENESISLASFINNNPVAHIDSLGLYTLPIIIERNVDVGSFESEDAHFFAFSGGIRPGEVINCTTKSVCDGQKLKGLVIDVVGKIQIKRGSTGNEKMLTGQTLLEHEQDHAANYESYITAQETIYLYLTKACLRPLCFRAWVAYVQNYVEPYESARLDYKNAVLDCADYRGSCNERESLLAIANQRYAELQSAYRNVQTACK
jgi:RHS repeat-associated protein